MKTILYYTSNRERPEFEQKIIETLLETSGGIPIVSVSQKPMDLGKNICVGDVGHSYLNLYRQVLMGAKKAQSEYVWFAESDFVYPPEYFKFEPGGEETYLYNNIWILFNRRVKGFRKKNVSHGAQVARREALIKRLEEGLACMPEWFDGNPTPWPSRKHHRKVGLPPHKLFGGNNPAVSFKTGDGVNQWTNVDKVEVNDLPYWGNVNNLRKQYV